MSCGQIALNQLGFKIEKYFAAEIKPHAIKCTQHNFPDTIQIGDVRKVSYKDGILTTANGCFEVGKIDLLIGGSPCQDLSILMRNREGLEGKKSSLFNEWLRIKEETNPRNFMLENVASMSVENKNKIDELLGVTGIFINSALFSAQLRKRYYWTNLNVDLEIEDKGVELQSILESGYTNRKKSVCIVRNYAGSVQSSNRESFIRMCNERSKKGFLTVVFEEKGNPNSVRLFTQTELERLQTVPVGYTSCVTYQEAADLIGDGWNIETVKHILKSRAGSRQQSNNCNYMSTEKKDGNNVMLIPSEKAFALSKVKTLKDGGLDVHYEVTEIIGNESYTNKYHVESAKDIHPDLRDCFDRLRPIMGRIFNITSFLSMVETSDFKATKKQSELSRDFADEMLKNIEVRGVSFSGQDDNVGVVLTGLFTVSNNQKTAINSPRLKFNTETLGFEEELEEIAADIETEVYAFLFKGKKAQLELFGADGEAAPGLNAEKDNGLFPDVEDPAEGDDNDGTDDETANM